VVAVVVRVVVVVKVVVVVELDISRHEVCSLEESLMLSLRRRDWNPDLANTICSYFRNLYNSSLCSNRRQYIPQQYVFKLRWLHIQS
jgi:hypothetical protein